MIKKTINLDVPNLEVLVDNKGAHKVFIAAMIVTLATIFVPSDLKMLDSPLWKILGMPEAVWSLYVTTRGLFYIILILGIGISGDFWGRRRVLLLSTAGFVFCVLLLIILPIDYPYLIVYSTATNLGIMLRILTITNIILVFKPEKRLLPVMFYSMLLGLSVIFSPLIAKKIWEVGEFRTIFIFPFSLAIIGFILASKYLPESRATGDLKRINVIAMALYTFGMCLIIFSILLAGGLKWTHPLVISGLAAGSIIILLLRWCEGVNLPGNLNFTLHFRGKLNVAIYAGVIINIALYAITVQIFNFFKQVQNFTVLVAGLALLPILVGAIGLTALTARYTVKLSAAKAMTMSLVVLAIPAGVLSFLTPNMSYFVILPCLMLLGFGFVLGNSPRLILLSSSVPPNLSATVQSVGSATALLGSGLGYTLMLMISHDFGNQMLINLIKGLNIPRAEISGTLLTLMEASDVFKSLIPSDVLAWMSTQVTVWIQDAYIYGLSRAMLLLSGVCLISAAVVYFGLYRSE